MENQTFTALISIQEEAGYFFPGRHFVSIGHNPLYRIMIEKLENNRQIDKIVINTDSAMIRNAYGRLPKFKVINAYVAEPGEIEMELTSDKVTTAMLEHAEGEHFIQLGAIFPFLKASTIESTLDTYYKQVTDAEDPGRSFDSVLTIRTLSRRMFDSDNDLVREDRPNTFVEDGILHVFNRTTFKANGNRKVGKKPFGCGVDEIENMAIDSEENYLLAEFVDKTRHRFKNVFR